MKKYSLIYILSVICSLSYVFLSCTDMTEDTTGQMVSSDFYADPSLIPQAVGAAYAELQAYQNHWGVWGLQTVSSDECVVPTRAPGNDWYDGGVWQDFHRHQWQYNLDALNNVWISVFSGITTCNRVVYDLDTYKDEMDVDIYNKYRAETVILRCFYYSILLDLFGNVPYIDTYESEITASPQTSRSELYQSVVDCIIENLEYLEEAPSVSNYGRCTKSMAYTMLAKLYLNAKVFKSALNYDKEDMNKVIEYCDKVINSGYYEIVSDFSAPFKVANESCKENIFVVPMQNGINSNSDYEFHFHKFSGHPKSRQMWGINVGGWNGGCATPDFLALFKDDDARKKASFIYGLIYDKVTGEPVEDGDNPGKQLELTIEITSINAANRWEGARIQKYEYELGMTGNMNNDFVLYRLADVYYMKAEAILRGGDKATLSDLCSEQAFQLIRERADQPIYTSETLSLGELINERGREFAWEGWRRQDLIRWDKFAKGSWTFKEALNNNSRDLFPIPYDQITKNKSWVQNPGY